MARNLCQLAGLFVVAGLGIGVGAPLWMRLFPVDAIYVLIVALAILGIGAALGVIGCGILIVDTWEQSKHDD